MRTSRTSLELFLSLGALTGVLGAEWCATGRADAMPAAATAQKPSSHRAVNEGGEGGEGGEIGGSAESGSRQAEQASPGNAAEARSCRPQQHATNNFEGGEGGERGALKNHPFYIKAKNEVEFESTNYEENLTELRLGYETMLGKRTYFHVEAGPGYATNADGVGGAITGTEAKLVQAIGDRTDLELKYVGRYGHASEVFNSELEAELKYRF